MAVPTYGTDNPDAAQAINELIVGAVFRVLKDEDANAWPDRPAVRYVEWVGSDDPDPPAAATDTWVKP